MQHFNTQKSSSIGNIPLGERRKKASLVERSRGCPNRRDGGEHPRSRHRYTHSGTERSRQGDVAHRSHATARDIHRPLVQDSQQIPSNHEPGGHLDEQFHGVRTSRARWLRSILQPQGGSYNILPVRFLVFGDNEYLQVRTIVGGEPECYAGSFNQTLID